MCIDSFLILIKKNQNIQKEVSDQLLKRKIGANLMKTFVLIKKEKFKEIEQFQK